MIYVSKKEQELEFTHEKGLGYVLMDGEDVLLDIPIEFRDDVTLAFRKDVIEYMKQNKLSRVIQDVLEEGKIRFENGIAVSAYSRYEDGHEYIEDLWGSPRWDG